MDNPGLPQQPDVAPGERDERVRTRLLNAAVYVFDRKGYAGASVREVAELAGVTKPALYYHFGSKEGVLRAILDEATRQVSVIAARTTAGTGSSRERIVRFCEETYALFGENVPVARVALAVLLGPPELAPAYDFTAFEREYRTVVERLVREGQASGEFRQGPPEDIAFAVLAILGGANDRLLNPAFEPIGVGGLVRMLAWLFDGVAVRNVREGEQSS